MSGLEQEFLPWFLDWQVKATGILTLAWGLARLLRGRSAASRHLVWALSFFVILALPIVQFLLSRAQLSIVLAGPLVPGSVSALQSASGEALIQSLSSQRPSGSVESDFVAEQPLFPEAMGQRDATDLAGLSSFSANANSSEFLYAWTEGGMVLWVLGVLVVLLRLLLGVWSSTLWARQGFEASSALKSEARQAARDLRLARSPQLILSSRVRSPFSLGILRARVLLPQDFASWPQARRRAVLRHELGHIRRGDAMAQIVCQFVLALCWFHPLLWWARRSMAIEAEIACDDLAVAGGEPPLGYARSLLDVARCTATMDSPVALGMASASALETRIQALLNQRQERRPLTRPMRGAGMLSAAALLLLCGALRLWGQEPVSVPAEEKLASKHWTVAQDGSGDCREIQGALRLAPPGAVIEIGPGIYNEALTILKSVSLLGAGVASTQITVDCKQVQEDPAVAATLRVQAAEVLLKGLTLSLRGDPAAGVELVASLSLEGDRVLVEDCAVVGSPGHGVVVQGRDAVIKNCLVSSVRRTGIAVRPALYAQGNVEILGCDVRDCYHRGITVTREQVRIQDCRISGSSWHGIRYDSVSPTIRHNALFANERFGIYASGSTHATVEENLFLDNGMAGFSAWFHCQDRIQGNTFVHNQRSGLEILGASKPTVSRNLFVGSPHGVSASNIQSQSPRAQSQGTGDLGENWFFDNGVALSDPSSAGPPSFAGTSDPRFSDPENRDFSLAEDSLARRSWMGVAEPLSLRSPWPAEVASTEESGADRPSERLLQDPAAEVVLGLLESRDPAQLREVLRALWGRSVNSAVEARLLELSRTDREYDCVYFALSTLPDKSQSVLQRLFEAAQQVDQPNLKRRALWGLGHGVPPEYQAWVEAEKQRLGLHP